MTGKGIAQFFWWAIYAVVALLLYRHYHIPIAYILWLIPVSIIYNIGDSVIKRAK